MSDEYVDPVGQPPKIAPVGSGGRQDRHQPPAAHGLRGEVTAVHRQTGHSEPGHLLDTTVGAQPHTELIVRVETDDVSHLVGKKVLVQVLP